MIHEIDEALRGLLLAPLSGSGAELVLDAPTREWAARRTGPAVNAYLYDIREELSRRERGLVALRDDRGVVVKHRQPYRWFRLSYLVTAWTATPQDEHRLLSAVLACLLRNDFLPPEALGGVLAELGVPVPVSAAAPPAESRSLADIWSAMGGELKPSLDVVVTTPFPVSPEFEAAPPVTQAGVRVRSTTGSPDDSALRTGPRGELP